MKFFRIIYKLYLKFRGLYLTQPTNLLDFRRFDIPAKTLYIKFKTNNIQSKWGEEIYKEHLRVWNGFNERAPKKESFVEYKSSFDKLIQDFKLNKFKSRNSPVVVTLPQKQLFDGSHRLAISTYFNKDIVYKTKSIDINQYDFNFFKNRKEFVNSGLRDEYCDQMALEYCRLKNKDLFIITLFPIASGKVTQSEEIIKKYSNIVYKKSIKINPKSSHTLIKQIYLGEPWANDDNLESVSYKANGCFAKEGKIRVYLVELNPNKDIVELKESIRKLYNAGKHSVHINDTYEETLRLASIFFNENSLKFINSFTSKKYNPEFYSLFKQYKEELEQLKIDKEFVCATASTVLGLYNLRANRDFDFIYTKYKNLDRLIKNPLIGSHNKFFYLYTKHLDDIVMNPKNHFYFEGYKFATLEIIRKMKHRRNESKDQKDISIIDKFVKNSS